MKRSEMIREMVIHMSRKDWLEPNMDYDEYLDKLLTRIEELGMLAPTTKLDKIDASDNGWEAEDEKTTYDKKIGINDSPKDKPRSK